MSGSGVTKDTDIIYGTIIVGGVVIGVVLVLDGSVVPPPVVVLVLPDKHCSRVGGRSHKIFQSAEPP